ncbi:hypothetical protein G3M48_004246 [Beauveria asiatica]|uniref:N-acetyltransferase domain-containing protein n=1 Tax=Beauveria asiatica TaxID=1069075 RepID=A0AAW0RTT6_9HYPO
MGFKVMPAGEQDAARSVAIEKMAYSRDPISRIIFPGPAGNDSDAAREKIMLQSLRADPESCLWIQVVDEDRIAQGLHGMVCFGMGYLWKSTPPPPTKKVWGPGSNPEACEQFFGGMTREWSERMGNKPHLYEADKHGLKSYLEATDEGRPLYEKFGYETVQVLVTDFSEWGGPDKVENCLMLRKPRPSS